MERSAQPVRSGRGQSVRFFGISRRAAILGALVSLGAILALSSGVHGRIVAAFALVGPLFSRAPVLGVSLYVALAALSAVIVFFSGVLLVPVGIDAWGQAVCFLLLWLGWILGGLVTYAMGRHLGRPFVRRVFAPTTISRYEGFIPAGGTLVTATLLQMALPSDISGYFFGLLGYQARVYVGALALAELPYALAAVYLGSAFMQRQYWLLLLAAAVALGAFVWCRWRGRCRPGLR